MGLPDPASLSQTPPIGFCNTQRHASTLTRFDLRPLGRQSGTEVPKRFCFLLPRSPQSLSHQAFRLPGLTLEMKESRWGANHRGISNRFWRSVTFQPCLRMTEQTRRTEVPRDEGSVLRGRPSSKNLEHLISSSTRGHGGLEFPAANGSIKTLVAADAAFASPETDDIPRRKSSFQKSRCFPS